MTQARWHAGAGYRLFGRARSSLLTLRASVALGSMVA
jgi:hypothetical protein